MSLTPKEKETIHLKKVYKILLAEYEQRLNQVNNFKINLIKAGRDLWQGEKHTWEQGDIDAASDVKQALDIIENENRKYRQAANQLLKIEKLKESPYFGRMDFIEEGYDKEEKIYIGTSTLFDKGGDILIYDWRAPVSSMFYDYDISEASYKCPEGLIRGEITLKRQFKISKDQLLYMFDTGIKIDDELLQQILSQNTDEKMRSIVTTIQREQNRIIRDEDHQLLMLQGVAGSGKTSIALHRIAYLLYRYRDRTISSNNILIFSPNTVFNDYISQVLPELGEENMQQTTFDEYLARLVGRGQGFEDSISHMEFVLNTTEDDKERLEAIAYKTSLAYYRMIKEYVSYIEQTHFKFYDISFKGNVLVSKEEMKELFINTYADMPIVKRLARLRKRLHYLIRPAWEERLKQIEEDLASKPDFQGKIKAEARLIVFKEFKQVRQQIDAMLDFDPYLAYTNMLSDKSFHQTLDQDILPSKIRPILTAGYPKSNKDILGYEDVSAYVYLKALIEGVPSMNHIKHVVVDEAQDYSPVQYGLLKKLFPNCGITLLGDLNQTINPLRPDFDYSNLVEILRPKNHVTYRLTKGYRSTSDIVEFTRHILKDGHDIESIARSGDKPTIVKAENEADMIGAILRDINKGIDGASQSIGLICKTAKEARHVYNRIKNHTRASLLTKDDKTFKSGLLVLPVYLAKGLEFDLALVYQANEENYGQDKDRKLLYTASTRALHRLILYHTGSLSPLLRDLPKDSFEQETILKKNNQIG